VVVEDCTVFGAGFAFKFAAYKRKTNIEMSNCQIDYAGTGVHVYGTEAINMQIKGGINWCHGDAYLLENEDAVVSIDGVEARSNGGVCFRLNDCKNVSINGSIFRSPTRSNPAPALRLVPKRDDAVVTVEGCQIFAVTGIGENGIKAVTFGRVGNITIKDTAILNTEKHNCLPAEVGKNVTLTNITTGVTPSDIVE